MMTPQPKRMPGGAYNVQLGYRQQQIMTASPDQLILILYDLALTACSQKDSSRLSRVLAELIDSLDFSYEDVATGFFRLYEYCLTLAHERQFETVSGIIKELRDAWGTATQGQYQKAAT
jgi:flagellar protein FliS